MRAWVSQDTVPLISLEVFRVSVWKLPCLDCHILTCQGKEAAPVMGQLHPSFMLSVREQRPQATSQPEQADGELVLYGNGGNLGGLLGVPGGTWG